ncbi:MAG: hypothetical protein HYS77_07265 [Candidatus Rokubacteria bacterium]|nr:hypothetical protein [Candidatus Rokubacteria bacterium]
MSTLAVVLGVSLVLIVFPIYVNQVGISLASPLTVRVVLAVGPVLIFLLQLIEGRLSPSPYSLASAVLYGVFAVSATLVRRRAIRSAALRLVPSPNREAGAPETCHSRRAALAIDHPLRSDSKRWAD